MNREEKDLVRFAARWAPYGGAPASDVFETFGMTLDRYHGRLRQILGTDETGPPPIERSTSGNTVRVPSRSGKSGPRVGNPTSVSAGR